MSCDGLRDYCANGRAAFYAQHATQAHKEIRVLHELCRPRRSFKAGEDLTFGASAGYFVSEEDKIADVEVMALAGGLVYKIMENTSLQLQLQYADGTLNETAATRSLGLDGDQDFDNFSAGTGLFVKF